MENIASETAKDEQAPSSAAAPVMDVVPPPAEEAEDSTNSPRLLPENKESSKKPAKKAPKPKQPSGGVGLAIFATTIIVLGLAVLATYAYLKTR